MSFRLQSLLRLRHLQRDAAASRAGAAARRAAEARGHTEELRGEVSAWAFAPTGDVRSFAAVVAARSASTSRYQEAVVVAAQLDQAAAAAEDAWSGARRSARALERLEEHHTATERAEELRVEQAALDEVGSRSAAVAAAAGPTEHEEVES